MASKKSDRDVAAERPQQTSKIPAASEKDDEQGVVSAQIAKHTPLSHHGTTDATRKLPLASPKSAHPKAGPDSSSPDHTTLQDQGNAQPLVAGKARIRVAATLIALIPLTLLVIAGNLTPAKQGLGTHQQLGLPPCSLRYLAGIRCPACGMTTSWAYFTKGHWLPSLQVNAGGFLLACLSIATIGIATQSVRYGRIPSQRVQKSYALACVAIFVVTLLDWIGRLQN